MLYGYSAASSLGTPTPGGGSKASVSAETVTVKGLKSSAASTSTMAWEECAGAIGHRVLAWSAR
jgi:hypothetical protein